MTQKENIQIGSISVAMMRLFIEGLKEDERLQIAVRAILKEGDVGSLMYALGSSFPLIVKTTLTNHVSNALQFNHFMNILCFQKGEVATEEKLEEMNNDEIIKAINDSIAKLSNDLSKEITILTQFEDLKN